MGTFATILVKEGDICNFNINEGDICNFNFKLGKYAIKQFFKGKYAIVPNFIYTSIIELSIKSKIAKCMPHETKFIGGVWIRNIQLK
ncbi:hypothetical protein Hanom_Chr09g00869781 [Helianthus anomalus]